MPLTYLWKLPSWRHSNLAHHANNFADVPIGGTLDAVRQLEVKLGIDLTGEGERLHKEDKVSKL